ncbi:MAG: hypothetical protein EOO50_05510 [Flavobacterium sp.]|uniref:hypothetical protein n=1 Tax=Flavobacterium sp. TaxID=239 RepID=UPI00121AF262|nr:hypothetical protein [Flavobacterium sp.]RZJ67445.1 MAG: hypothetical protein EOO50_05510 [Flavobacterium sp.]
MELHPTKGIGPLLFGMKQSHVEAIMGKPDKHFKDEDKNVIWAYNAAKLRLTFYEDEDFRFGYLISANPDLTLSGNQPIGKKVAEVKENLPQKTFKTWEVESFDTADNHFNEANWLILQEEFGVVAKVEMGAVIVRDEFEWAF